MLEEMARLLKLNLAELKQHDQRAPLDEIKRLTEQDPGYAFAFRTLLDRKLQPEELLQLVFKRQPPHQGGQTHGGRSGHILGLSYAGFSTNPRHSSQS